MLVPAGRASWFSELLEIKFSVAMLIALFKDISDHANILVNQISQIATSKALYRLYVWSELHSN